MKKVEFKMLEWYGVHGEPILTVRTEDGFLIYCKNSSNLEHFAKIYHENFYNIDVEYVTVDGKDRIYAYECRDCGYPVMYEKRTYFLVEQAEMENQPVDEDTDCIFYTAKAICLDDKDEQGVYPSYLVRWKATEKFLEEWNKADCHIDEGNACDWENAYEVEKLSEDDEYDFIRREDAWPMPKDIFEARVCAQD